MILESVASAILIVGSNGLDMHSTNQALKLGAYEINGPMKMAGTPLKIAFTAGEIIVFEKLKKKHKKAAWAWTLTITGVNLLIYKHNKGVIKELKSR